MVGISKAKRRVKPQTETSMDSYLWRLANRRDSCVIVLVILAGTFFAGMITAWVM